MSLKAELETWAAALKAYDAEDFEKSLELFSVRAPSCFLRCNLIAAITTHRTIATIRPSPPPRNSLQTWALCTLILASRKLRWSSSMPLLILIIILPLRALSSLPRNTTIFIGLLFSSYFQCGVSNFLLGRYEFSARDFEEALLYLRG